MTTDQSYDLISVAAAMRRRHHPALNAGTAAMVLRAQARLDELEAIVAKLSRTADGVVAVPDMTVYGVSADDGSIVEIVVTEPGLLVVPDDPEDPEECWDLVANTWSTRAAAKAAREADDG